MTNQTKNIKTVDSIIQHFEKKDVITNLLLQHDIAKIKSVESVQRYKKDANRGGLIISCKGECTDQTEKILIDFKLGEPCIDQVNDAIYTQGKDCSKRIIMFGGVGESDAIGPATDEYVVGSLITSMNEYSLNLVFVKLDCNHLDTEVYDLIFPEQVRHESAIFEIPSEERFREAEFWNVYFDSLNDGFYQSWTAFEYGISNKSKYGWFLSDNAVEVKLNWTNEGVLFTVTQTHDDTDRFEEIWQTKNSELRQLFRDNEMQFIYSPGKLPKITIKFWDLPLNCLISASNAEKIDYAKSLHSRLDDLADIMDI
jgi:hypothetical protein